jgi:putative transcriptional regulator
MKKKRMADGLLQGLKEAVAIKKGDLKAKAYTLEVPPPAPVFSSKKIKFIRVEIFNMSQPTFADLCNVKVATVRAWEQGQKSPSGAASRLLEILEKEKSSIVHKLAS